MIRSDFCLSTLEIFCYSFQDNSIWVSLLFGLSVYKWELPALPITAIRSTNHCYQSVARILIILHAQNCPVAMWEGDLSLAIVHKGPLDYAEGSPLTIILYSPIER